MAGKPLHELRRSAAQSRVKTIPADRVEVIDPPAPAIAPEPEPAPETEARSLNDILSDAKLRAARGEENDDILAMVKSLKGMLHGDWGE